jgi:polysaccharide biosynthesis transport protein
MADTLDAEAASANARAADIERRLGDADAVVAAEAELATLESKVAETQGLLDAALRRQETMRENGALPTDVQLLSRATIPSSPDWPQVGPLTALAFLVALLAGIAILAIRELASGRALRRVPFEPLADIDQPQAAAGRFRRVEEDGVPRAMADEPTLAPAADDTAESSLGAVADGVAGRRRIVVTLAEGSDAEGRPLAAAALVRALAGRDRSVVLVDLHTDGANSVAMGEAADLPGFGDLVAGEASFAQVIFRDRRSRAHFVPSGLQTIRPEALSGERLATLLTALDHTYDHVVIDCPDDVIAALAPGADAALVASEYVNMDPRTVRAVARIAKVSAARIFHLLVEPARRPSSPEPEPEPTAEAA